MEGQHIVKLGRLTRYEAFCALFNKAKAQGLGRIQYNCYHNMTVEEAEQFLSRTSYADYVEGRVMKVSFPEGAKELDCTLYDRDNGDGSAEKAIRRYEDMLDGYGCSNLYIPRVFAGAKCEVNRRAGNIFWEYKLLGGTLSVYLQNDMSTRGGVSVTFEFKLPIPNSSRYLQYKRYSYPSDVVGESEFVDLSNCVISSVVQELITNWGLPSV